MRSSTRSVVCLIAIIFLAVFLPRSVYGGSPCWNLKLKEKEYNFCILDMEEHKERIQSFNLGFPRDGNSKLDFCFVIVDLPVGVARGNHSYGGICTAEEPYVQPQSRYFRNLKSDSSPQQYIMICDDEMVGHFKAVSIKGDLPDLIELAEFVAGNCYGG